MPSPAIGIPWGGGNKRKASIQMKILQISNYYFPFIGGIEQVARDCSDALKGAHEVKVFCFHHEKGDACGEVDGVQVIRAGCFAKVSSQSLSFSYGKLLKKTFREFRPDVVIFHYPNPFAAHFLKKQLKNHPACKLILWWHLDITKQKILGKLFAGQTKWLLRRADKVVATSPNYIEGSSSLRSVREKCTVIPCCVSDARLHPSEEEKGAAQALRSENAGKTILLAMGRHVPYKGMEYLVRASKLLDERFAVWIGGQGPLTEELKKLADGDRKVTFLGRVSNEELKSRLLACDIFCFPSITKNEAFGIALAEAMAYGKPAVTFTIEGSGVNYVSLNGVTGLEAENRNVEAYAAAIEALSADEALRRAYGENAARRVRELFTFEAFVRNVNSLLESV